MGSENFAQFEYKSAKLSSSFGLELAQKKFNMTREQLADLFGEYKRKTKTALKGDIKGSIGWRKCTKGGWIKCGKNEWDGNKIHQYNGLTHPNGTCSGFHLFENDYCHTTGNNYEIIQKILDDDLSHDTIPGLIEMAMDRYAVDLIVVDAAISPERERIAALKKLEHFRGVYRRERTSNLTIVKQRRKAVGYMKRALKTGTFTPAEGEPFPLSDDVAAIFKNLLDNTKPCIKEALLETLVHRKSYLEAVAKLEAIKPSPKENTRQAPSPNP